MRHALWRLKLYCQTTGSPDRRPLFANAAEAIPARRITSVPALPAITILAPGFVVGVVAVLRNKVPVVDVEAPEESLKKNGMPRVYTRIGKPLYTVKDLKEDLVSARVA